MSRSIHLEPHLSTEELTARYRKSVCGKCRMRKVYCLQAPHCEKRLALASLEYG